MAFTSLQALVATAAALPVAGVKRQLPYRPNAVQRADLPLMYTRPPRSTRATSTLTYAQNLRHGTLEIVILVEELNLSRQSEIDALTVLLLDNLALAVETNAEVLGLDSYELTTDEDTIGDGAAPVQVIVGTIEVSG